MKLDFNNVMAEAIGTEHGLRPEEIDALKARASQIHRDLLARRKKDIGFYNLPYDDAIIKEIYSISKALGSKFENLAVLGIGGSALGAKAVFNSLCHPQHNLLPRGSSYKLEPARNGTRLFFCDNIDPDSFISLINMLDLKKTLFNVITKSGETVETVAQFMVIKRLLEKNIGEKYKDHIVITTDPLKGSLRRIADEEGFISLPVPQNVGGRYSVFSAVGLFPSAMAGVDIKKLCEGARQMDEICSTGDIWKNPVYMSAILQYLAYQKGKNISVIMPYSNALKDFAEWYIQLWAESLGKKMTGPTPIKAIGATDQHSQLQLYMEGPYDKIITFISVERFNNKILIPKLYKDVDGVGYLGGHTIGELFMAEQLATQIALTKKRRMNYNITLPEINPFTIGQLLFLFEVQTAFAGGLFEVNPFDQPGVEEGKQLTYGMMGKKGYEDKKGEIESRPEGNKRYVI